MQEPPHNKLGAPLDIRKEVGLNKNITMAKTIHIIAIIIKLLSPLSWAGPGSPSYEQTGYYTNDICQIAWSKKSEYLFSYY